MNNPLPNDDYASMTGGERRERASRQRQVFALMRELDPRLASFRCRMCGEWFKMNFKAASGHICTKCDEEFSQTPPTQTP